MAETAHCLLNLFDDYCGVERSFVAGAANVYEPVNDFYRNFVVDFGELLDFVLAVDKYITVDFVLAVGNDVFDADYEVVTDFQFLGCH